MEDNNKRILKNTVYLYLRQFVIMALSFFTTRIVLEKLGASDSLVTTCMITLIVSNVYWDLH
jgi:hypothetical protein